MTKKDAIVIAISLFACHPDVKEFTITTDQQAFFTNQDALNHAQSLPEKEREVITINREDAADADLEKQGDGEKTTGAVKPYKQWLKEDLAAEAARLGIELPAEYTKQILIDLIEAASKK